MQKINLPEWGVWSRKFGRKWEEAFVVGNGSVGGMLYGPPQASHLILNAPDYFLKGNPMQHIPDMAPFLQEFRKRIAEEGYEAAIIFYEEEALKQGYPGLTMSDPIHPLLQLDWQFTDVHIEENSYLRMTDFATGVVAEQFSSPSDAHYQKRMWVNAADELTFIIEGDKPFSGKLTLIHFNQERLRQVVSIQGELWRQENTYLDGSGYFTAGEIDCNGEVTHDQDSFSIQNATSLTLRMVLNKSTFASNNKSNWTEGYQKTSLTLTTKSERLRSIDDILAEMEETGAIPLVLYEKLYAASRYAILSYSGKSIPNLQGIWTGTFQPAWSGDYTFDTNVQLAIASFTRLGLFQELRAVFDRLEDYFSDFEENALHYYGCRGYLVPGHASTTAKQVQWNPQWPLVTWTAGATWLAHFYAEYVSYTKDKTFLKEQALPFYQKTIAFYEDFLLWESDGTALFRPSYSPENGMGDNATFDVAALKETLKNALEAYQTLKLPIPENYQRLLAALPAYAVNQEGILKEWIDPEMDENYNHRHFSQFYPLFESKEFSREHTPELWQATEAAFARKMAAWVTNPESGNSSSHGRMHAAFCAIALGRTEDFDRSLGEFIQNRAFFDSLLSAHYNQQNVFNVDANGALPRIYQEALLYSPDEENLVLFQAVPNWLAKGSLKGVWLPNQIEVVSFEWNLPAQNFTLKIKAKQDVTLFIQINDYIQNTQLSIRLKGDTIKTIRFDKGMMR